MTELMSQRIHDKRIEKNLTLEELGQRLGVQSSAVSKWEKGRVTNIRQSTIKAMADIFGCSPVWLMGIEDNEVPDYVPGTVEIIDLYSRATPEQRQAVLNLLRSFVND